MGLISLLLPPGSDSLPLSVELNGSFTVEVSSSPHRSLVSSEREHREWDRNRQVDSNLSGLDFVLEFSSVSSGLGENGNTITPRVAVDELDGLIKSLHSADDHNRSKEFIIVTVHTRLSMINDGRANPVSIRKAVNLGVSSIKKNLCTLVLGVFDLLLKSLQLLLSVERSNIMVGGAGSNSKIFSLLDDFGKPFICCVTYHNTDGDGHASLSGGTETSTDHSVDSIFSISVRHKDGVVLSTHVDLASLAVIGRSLVDVLTS